jgi:hypothetical protein
MVELLSKDSETTLKNGKRDIGGSQLSGRQYPVQHDRTCHAISRRP